MNINPHEAPLSDDPEENLRMENELLRLKMQAELGSSSYSSPGLDPQIENEFLKNVMAFENSYANSQPATVFHLLGKPYFKKPDELNDEQLERALEEITTLMSAKNVEVDFSEDVDSHTRYEFIVDELFAHETTFFPVGGMTVHFDYEEFHPNHKKDIENRAKEFLEEWFKQSLNEKSWELADTFILPDGKLLSKAAVAAQLTHIFDAYTAFTDDKYVIKEVGFQLQEGGGLGHAEGLVRYNAVLENGESVPIGGHFKLYMTLEYGWWSIFHIVFPGFEYE